MPTYTLRQPVTGVFRMHINSGGRCPWCEFAYTCKPVAGIDGVDVQLVGNADAASRKWFSYLKEGILVGVEKREIKVSGVQIVIGDIKEHPVNTTADGCTFYGISFFGCFATEWQPLLIPLE